MTDCILWQGRINSTGYGAIGRKKLAHRAAWEEANGPIPDGNVVHHTCGNKACVNPDHLESISHAEHNLHHQNAASWYERMRAITHCPQGHEYTPENTKIKRGRRHCRECARIYSRSYYAARAAA